MNINLFHFVIKGKTTAELINERVDLEKTAIGLEEVE